MSGDAVEQVRRSLRRSVRGAKRDALLAALAHPGLVRARRTASGLLLEGPGGIMSTHLSAGDYRSAPVLRDLRRIGLLDV